MITELDIIKSAIQFKIDTLKSEIENDEKRIAGYSARRKFDYGIIGVEIGMTAEKKRILEWLEKLRGTE